MTEPLLISFDGPRLEEQVRTLRQLLWAVLSQQPNKEIHLSRYLIDVVREDDWRQFAMTYDFATNSYVLRAIGDL